MNDPENGGEIGVSRTHSRLLLSEIMQLHKITTVRRSTKIKLVRRYRAGTAYNPLISFTYHYPLWRLSAIPSSEGRGPGRVEPASYRDPVSNGLRHRTETGLLTVIGSLARQRSGDGRCKDNTLPCTKKLPTPLNPARHRLRSLHTISCQGSLRSGRVFAAGRTLYLRG